MLLHLAVVLIVLLTYSGADKTSKCSFTYTVDTVNALGTTSNPGHAATFGYFNPR